MPSPPPLRPAHRAGWEKYLLLATGVALTGAMVFYFFGLTEDGPRKPLIALSTYPKMADLYQLVLTKTVVLCLGLFTLLLGMEQLRMNFRTATPIITSVMFWAAVIESQIPLVSDNRSMTNEIFMQDTYHQVELRWNTIMWVWVLFRTAAMALVIAAVAVSLARHRKIQNRLGTVLAHLGGLVLVLVCLVVVGSRNLPPDMGLATVDPKSLLPADQVLRSPWDLIPALLLIGAGLFVLPAFHRRQKTFFSLGLWLSVLPLAGSHLLMAFGSSVPYDRSFLLAHHLPLVGYGLWFTSLLLDHSRTYVEIRNSHQQLEYEIAGRLMSERQTADSKAMYRSLVESLPLAVFRKDRQGCFTFANDRFCREVGMEMDDLIGCTDQDLFPEQLANATTSR